MTNFYIRLRFFEEINYVISSSMRNEITRVGWTNFFCQSVGQNTYLMEIHSRPSLIQRLILKIAILHFPLTFACGIIPFRFLAWSLVHPVSGKMKKKKKRKRYIRYFDSEGKRNILHIFYICTRYMHTVELRLYELHLHIRRKF